MKVRANSKYVYNAAGYDRVDPKATGLTNGDVVTVVKLIGCPPPNTMGHAHVNGPDGKFAGLVDTLSLSKA